MTEINWGAVNSEIQARVKQAVAESKTKAQSLALRAANQLRNSEQRILRGQRGGRKYKMPHSNATYTASAPGEPPARRTGALRASWGLKAEGDGNGTYTASIYTDISYAGYMEEGTPGGKIAPRPFVEKIVEDAKPKIISLGKQMFS